MRIAEQRNARVRVALGFAAALLTLALTNCGGGADKHLDSAREYLSQGLPREALIEYTNAIKFSPLDPQVNFEMAQVLTTLGHLAEARFYYDEAYRLDPEFSEAAARLASLTSGGDPKGARKIIDELLLARPNDAWGLLGLAQLHLEAGDADSALEAAERAIASDPELPEAYLQLARVHQGRIATHFAENRSPPPDADYEAAFAALDRADELGAAGRPWRSAMERAHLLSFWSGHAAEAATTFQKAYDQATEGGADRARGRIIERAIEYGQRTRNGDLLGWAFARQTLLRPFDTQAWESLAQTSANRGGSYEGVLLTRLKLHPEDSGAHASYANFLLAQRGLDAAEKYLLEQVEADRSEGQPAELLATLARLQQTSGEGERAVKTASELAGRYPDAPAAIVMNAWRYLRRLQPKLAIGVLSEHEWVPTNAEALSLLVDSHAMLGNRDGEVLALKKLLELLDPESVIARRIEARIAHHQGEHSRAANFYARLRQRKAPLSETETIWFAQSAYRAELPQLGRSALAELVERQNPSLNATNEYARHEFAHPRRRRIARKAFDLILASEPRSRQAINGAVALEVASNEPQRALARLDAGIAAESEEPARATDLRVQKAQLLDSMGRREEARREAWAAFETRPEYPRALPVLVGLYEDEATQEIARRGKTIGGGLTPTEHAFVGRLHELTGNERLARWSFEQALNGGVDIPILRNDLAYLLAKQKTDLERAMLLAQQAAQRLGDAAPVADTLGYVQLASGNPTEAERYFKHAVELAEKNGEPTSQYRFHLALAMRDIGKTGAAQKLVGEILKEDPDFPDADEAQRMLRRAERQEDAEARRLQVEERRKARDEKLKQQAAQAAAAAEKALDDAGKSMENRPGRADAAPID